MSRNANDSRVTNYTALGLSLGLVFGVTLGLIIWLISDQFVFFPIFMGSGISTGLAIGVSLDQRREEKADE